MTGFCFLLVAILRSYLGLALDFRFVPVYLGATPPVETVWPLVAVTVASLLLLLLGLRKARMGGAI